MGETVRSGDVIIVGGGVVGYFLAYRLAHESIAVTVVDSSLLGTGATGASAGNLQPIRSRFRSFEALGTESLRLYRRFIPVIKEESGIDLLDHDVNWLHAALHESEVVQLQQLITDCQQDGLRVEWVDDRAAVELEPRLVPEVLGGMLHYDCAQIDASKFLTALSIAGQRKGVRVLHAEAVGFAQSGLRVTGIRLKDGSVASCDSVVLAMGAWTGEALRRWTGVSLPISPYSLQSLRLRPEQDALRVAVTWDGINVVPRGDGLTHLGSKHDPMGFQARPTQEGRRWLLERINAILPNFGYEVVDSMAGSPAMTPNRIPIVGPLQTIQGVSVVVPSINGFLLAAVLADIMTNLLTRGEDERTREVMSPKQAIESAPRRTLYAYVRRVFRYARGWLRR